MTLMKILIEVNKIQIDNVLDRPGYSYLDWEYSKRKSENPGITFSDILKEKIKKLEDEDEKSSL